MLTADFSTLAHTVMIPSALLIFAGIHKFCNNATETELEEEFRSQIPIVLSFLCRAYS